MPGSAITPFLETVGGSSMFEFTLDASANPGDSTITLDRPAAPLPGSNVIAVIDPFQANCELRAFTVAGSTFTLDSGLLFSHASGVPVYVLTQNEISTYFFGCKADSATDDWRCLQRGIYETCRGGWWLDGMGSQHECSQPLIGNNPHLRRITIRCTADFAPVDAAPGAMLMQCQDNPQAFTCSASDNTFTVANNTGIGGIGNMICFNAPDGETLPTPIVSGRVYFVKTAPTGTTFTVSTTNGGSELDITVDGTGWMYPDLLTMGRVFLEDVYLKVASHGVVGLNGLSCMIQQPAYTNKLRVDYNTGIAVRLDGQISNHYNMELVGSGTGGVGAGLQISGSGHTFFGVNIVSGGTPVSDGAVGTHMHGLWIEQQVSGLVCGITAGVGAVYDIQTFAPQDDTTPMLSVGDAASSYTIRGPRLSSSGYLVLNDTARGITLHASDFPGEVVSHLTQSYGAGSGPGPLVATGNLDFGSISAGASSDLTITVNGAIPGQAVAATPGGLEAGLIWNAWVSATNTVTIRVNNTTAAPIDPANRAWKVVVLPS